MRKEIDLHGYKIPDALQVVHEIVGQVRIAETEEDWCFITGGGPIHTAVKYELEDYGLSTDVPAHNLGVVNVTVE